MRRLILAVAAALAIPAAHAQDGNKGMEMKDKQHGAMHDKMHDKMHDRMHDKMEKKTKGKPDEKKGEAAKKDEHGH